MGAVRTAAAGAFHTYGFFDVAGLAVLTEEACLVHAEAVFQGTVALATLRDPVGWADPFSHRAEGKTGLLVEACLGHRLALIE
jgi:hypothetical protein